VKILEAADDWKTPPYEIAGGGKLLWLLRWRVWKREKNKAEKAWQETLKSKS